MLKFLSIFAKLGIFQKTIAEVPGTLSIIVLIIENTCNSFLNFRKMAIIDTGLIFKKGKL